MIYFYITLSFVSILACYKWGDWANWEKYYPTILFFITGDLIYNILFRKKLLWRYNGKNINHTMTNMMMVSTVYPATVLMYIYNYPKDIMHQIVYMLMWISLFTVFEYISCKLNYFKHSFGWNIKCSAIFNIGLFILLNLHHGNPLIAWLIAMAALIITLKIFKVNVLELE
jgi:hypothetical protein